MKLDTKKIRLFLKSMEGAELIYLRYTMTIRQNLESLISEHLLTKDKICERFKIKPSQYNNFVKGDYNYTLEHLAMINAAFVELESEKIKENVPFKF